MKKLILSAALVAVVLLLAGPARAGDYGGGRVFAPPVPLAPVLTPFGVAFVPGYLPAPRIFAQPAAPVYVAPPAFVPADRGRSVIRFRGVIRN